MREPVQPTKRRKLTPAERGMLLHRQGGYCGCGCDHTLFNENDPRIWWAMIDEHILPLELGGSNDLSNRALYLVDCAKAKTRDDIKRIAKARRIRKRETEGAKPSRMQSRGFDKRLRKKLSGEVVRRDGSYIPDKASMLICVAFQACSPYLSARWRREKVRMALPSPPLWSWRGWRSLRRRVGFGGIACSRVTSF